jgi:multiple sugar transport system permease protein
MSVSITDTTTAATPAATSSARSDRRRRGRGDRRSTALMIALWCCALHFVLPLFWLLVASREINTDLFSSFGWFADQVSISDNLQTLFTTQDGIFGRWILNTIVYGQCPPGPRRWR